MVFVGMGQNQPVQPVLAFGDESRVRRDHVDPGKRGIAEGDAQIDHQPAAAIAEQVEVHADLAGAAERQEMEGVAAHARFLAKISCNPRKVTSGSWISMASVASEKVSASPPVATTFIAMPRSS